MPWQPFLPSPMITKTTRTTGTSPETTCTTASTGTTPTIDAPAINTPTIYI